MSVTSIGKGQTTTTEELKEWFCKTSPVYCLSQVVNEDTPTQESTIVDEDTTIQNKEKKTIRELGVANPLTQQEINIFVTAMLDTGSGVGLDESIIDVTSLMRSLFTPEISKPMEARMEIVDLLKNTIYEVLIKKPE